MDTLVRIRLRPLGVWTTPWQADSLMGALAVTWARARGPEALRRDLLDRWLAQDPPFVISDAFPGDSLPAPANLALWDWPEEQRKTVKKLRWLTPAGFSAAQRGIRPEPEPDLQSPTRDGIRLRNSVSRSANSAGGDGGQLFPIPYTTLTAADGHLSIYARCADGQDMLVEALSLLGLAGFGADASVGHGGFELVGGPDPCHELVDVPGANGFVSLSTYQPAPDDPVDGAWRAFVKYGTLAPEFHDVAVFKRPQVMLEAGAAFHTSGTPNPFYGAVIAGEHLLGAEQRQALAARGVHPVQAAFALAVPLNWA